MTCREQLFDNVTPAEYDALVNQAQSAFGVTITGTEGQQTVPSGKAKGFIFHWIYKPETAVLSLQCVYAPWPDSIFPGKIEADVAQVVQAAMSSGRDDAAIGN